MIRPILFLSCIGTVAMAAPPQVLTDIGPVQSLTAQVMGDLGTPALLLGPDTDVHHYAMSPRDAAKIADAGLIIRVGDALTPWLADPLRALAGDAVQLVLLDTTGWAPRDWYDDGHAHDIDPHAWLDPTIAAIWVQAISDALAAADPENAAVYVSNAQTAAADIAMLDRRIAGQLDGLSDGYILPHDGYRYFETRYGLQSSGAISQTDAADPGPARIAALRELVVSGDVVCVLGDREINPDWLALLTEGSIARIGQIDAIGTTGYNIAGGYARMMTGMATAFGDCLR